MGFPRQEDWSGLPLPSPVLEQILVSLREARRTSAPEEKKIRGSCLGEWFSTLVAQGSHLGNFKTIDAQILRSGILI